MGSRFEAFNIFRNFADKLRMKDQVNGPTTMDTSELRPVLDVSAGGFMEREVGRGATYGPGIDVAGVNSYVAKLISPSLADAALIVNRDGKDRRVICADLTLDLNAPFEDASLYGLEVEYYLKADPDETAEYPVAYYKMALCDATVTRYRFPLTGMAHPGAYISVGDPGALNQAGGLALACTWDKMVPVGWALYAAIYLWKSNGVAVPVRENFPAGSRLSPSVAAWAAKSGLQLPL